MTEFSALEHGLLGKKPAVHKPEDIKFSLLKETTPLPVRLPARFGHGTAFTDWLMLANGPDDSVFPGFEGAGCCVESMMGHTTMEAAKIHRRVVPRITGSEVIKAYSDITGYNLDDPNTDQGTYMHDAMGWWRNTGFADGAGKVHKIGAYVSIDPKDWDQLIEAVWVFGFVAIGFEFPASAMQQFDDNQPWDVVPGSDIEGGHCVPVYGRSSPNTAGPVSWGRRQSMTRAFYEEYNDESWAAVFPDELAAARPSVVGICIS
jgi:hypothetical protein